MKPSRRDLLQTAMAAGALPLRVTAQTAAGPLEEARKKLTDNAAALAAIPLPQTIEPAFTFKA
jgi:hypothetical protein